MDYDAVDALGAILFAGIVGIPAYAAMKSYVNGKIERWSLSRKEQKAKTLENIAIENEEETLPKKQDYKVY